MSIDWNPGYRAFLARPAASVERGQAAPMANRRDIARIAWSARAPEWKSDEAILERTAASFDNPDWVDLVVHSSPWQLGLEQRETHLAGAPTDARPTIGMPTITIEGDSNGVTPAGDSSACAGKFARTRRQRVLHAGYNVPHRAPPEFAAAVWTLASAAQ